MDPTHRAAPLWRPLGHVLPIRAFTPLRITCSQLTQAQRELLQELLCALGARWHDGLSTKCTHVVLLEASGAKFDYALKHGVKPVR